NFEFLRKTIKPRPYNAHKGSMGALLSICGSYGMAGAQIMSARSALRSGLGMLRLLTVDSVYQVVASVVHEAVFLPQKANEKGTFSRDSIPAITKNMKNSDAVLIGCGLGVNSDTQEIVDYLVLNCSVPLLIDADGINCLAKHIHLLKEKVCDIVLTPHPGEMSRLTGLPVKQITNSPQSVAEDFSREYGVVTVLKGADTVMTDGKNTFISRAGNPGMATGGSGDVLAGVIGSLLAQGYSPIEAAACGVFVHGTAGDLAREDLGETSMLPSDVIDYLHKVFKKVEE
ncbi:MAG: NAD(P)H-hydrate dehydratase, partial [Ruminococcus sp.]